MATELILSNLIATPIEHLMIPAKDVACVQEENSAEHALLILIKARYSAIPVLNSKSIVVGIISKTMILDSILGLERIEFEKLTTTKIHEVMNREVPHVTRTASFLHVLELCIQSAFLCVENETGGFVGLLTRQVILAEIYKYLRYQNGKINHLAKLR